MKSYYMLKTHDVTPHQSAIMQYKVLETDLSDLESHQSVSFVLLSSPMMSRGGLFVSSH